MVPIHEKNGYNDEYPFVSFGRQNLILWKMMERKAFLVNQSIDIMIPNEENVCIMPNQEKNGDKYKNPCSSFLEDTPWL